RGLLPLAARQRATPRVLLEARSQRSVLASVIAHGKCVFRLKSHSRDGVAYLMRKSRRQPPDSRQALGSACAAPLQRKPFAGLVQRVDQPVELLLASTRKFGKVD